MLERRLVSLITHAESGRRLIDWLCSRFSYYEREEWAEAIKHERVLINGAVARSETVLSENDTVEFTPETQEEPQANLSFSIIEESRDYAIVSKPANLPVHPSGRYFNNTLWALLKDVWPWFHFCTRLDRETSGLVLIALSKDFLHYWLKISDHSRNKSPVIKEYVALCFGEFTDKIDARGYLLPDSQSTIRKKLKFISDEPSSQKIKIPKDAVTCRTLITPVNIFSETDLSSSSPAMVTQEPRTLSQVRCRLYTGRTHQIRATLCSLGYPMVGDKLYGPDDTVFLRFADGTMTEEDRRLLILDRQALHCERLEFPWKNKKQVFVDEGKFA